MEEIIFIGIMKKHTYQINVEWTGNLGLGTKNYRSYDRSHEIFSEQKGVKILGSSDPSFKGDKSKYNPEELLVSTLSSCHMLWYLHLCAEKGINIISYIDTAQGVMEEFENGSGRFTKVTLSPVIKVENHTDHAQVALELHHKAHELCFIANSVNFEVRVEPNIL